MKTKTRSLFLTLALLSTLNSQLATAQAQGTAFTYQGRLNDGVSPVNGSYDLTFAVFGGATEVPPFTQISSTLTNIGVACSNGLFTVTLNFGNGIFPGADRFLEIGVRTNGNGAFATLSPRQRLAPTPYAITAGNLNGTVANGQLANSTLTVSAGTGLSGGGTVALGSSTTLNNAGVLSVNGNPDITVSTLNGAVTLGDTATSANTPNTIVKRDGSGNFSAGTITLATNLILPATTATIYSGNAILLRADGQQNFFAGPGAGNLTMSGYYNEANGYQALFSNTSGSFNTADGFQALNFNTTGNNNTANGYYALTSNTNGRNNTAEGAYALASNTSGDNNTANGIGALNFNLGGINNTASGAFALNANTNGSDNTANGCQALLYNTSGSENTANGFQALCFNTSGYNNTASGDHALFANTSGYNNAANGYGALNSNTTGYDNTASGFEALYYNTYGFNNTANGYQALLYNTSGSENTANGFQALFFNTSGYNNTASGDYALYANTSGYENAATGFETLSSNTSGAQNTASGNYALHSNTNGNYNTASGFDALYFNTSGINNTANGAYALNFNTSGVNNTANGLLALYSNTNGSYNVANGYQSLLSNPNGFGNTANGAYALYSNTNGSGNIALGYAAGGNLNSGDDNIYIGSGGSAAESGTLRIGNGNQTKTFVAGISGATAASGVAVYVNTSGQLGTLTSSARFKQNIRSIGDASDVLLSLRPVTFNYKPEIDPVGIPQFGLVAEEVDKVDPDLVARDDKNQIYTVRYEAVNAMLLNEFLKQHRKVQEQNAKLQELDQKVDAQISENAELKRRLDNLEWLMERQTASR